MAYENNSVELTWLFQIGTPAVETAQCSMKVSAGPAFNSDAWLLNITNTQVQTLLAGMATHLGGSTWWGGYSSLVGMKVASLDHNGHYTQEARSFLKTSASVGTRANVPPQSSQVITLWSGRHIGKSNFGRLYLPHCTNLMTTGQPQSSTTEAASDAASFKTNVFTPLQTVCSALDATSKPWVMSKLGRSFAINYVGVGTVTDTQQRRRNRLKEQVQYVSVP